MRVEGSFVSDDGLSLVVGEEKLACGLERRALDVASGDKGTCGAPNPEGCKAAAGDMLPKFTRKPAAEAGHHLARDGPEQRHPQHAAWRMWPRTRGVVRAWGPFLLGGVTC